jgi:hypothetical protein
MSSLLPTAFTTSLRLQEQKRAQLQTTFKAKTVKQQETPESPPKDNKMGT